MLIHISESAKLDAEEFEQHILSKGITDAGNYTKINQDRRWYYGYLGEWAFNEFLKNTCRKVGVKWERDADGFADDGDFFFDSKIVDVKTCTKASYKNIMMPNVQFLKKKKDFYVAVQLVEDNAQIIGYATHQDFADAPIENFGHGDTKAILFTKLRPIAELINQQILRKWEVNDEKI